MAKEIKKLSEIRKEATDFKNLSDFIGEEIIIKKWRIATGKFGEYLILETDKGLIATYSPSVRDVVEKYLPESMDYHVQCKVVEKTSKRGRRYTTLE